MKRCTVNLPDASVEAHLLADLLDSSTGVHVTLAELCPDVRLDSESSIVRALMTIAGRTLAEHSLGVQYERALAAGYFDPEAEAWHRAADETTRRMWAGDE